MGGPWHSCPLGNTGLGVGREVEAVARAFPDPEEEEMRKVLLHCSSPWEFYPWQEWKYKVKEMVASTQLCHKLTWSPCHVPGTVQALHLWIQR